MSFQDLFKQFSTIRIGVIGDVMLDTYWWGKVDRISPEAPVPVVAISHTEKRIGGAGNVALNLASLGAKVDAISVCGKDADGKELRSLLKTKKIGTDYITSSTERATTNKIRIISRNQHMMRLDAEVTNDLSPNEERALIDSFQNYVAKQQPNLIILEDYNKGVLSPNVIKETLAICKKNKILTAVDPKRKNFFLYKGVDLFKPNLHEAKESLNIIGDEVNDELLGRIHAELQEQLKHKTSFITLSEKGVYYKNAKASDWIHTHVRSIADVSGAGDTVIAVAALVFAATKNVRLMAEMANIAGGLVCEEVGTVAIEKEKLLQECVLLFDEADAFLGGKKLKTK